MPDQSQSNESVSGKTDQQTGNPADTSANSQDAATAESQESNVTRASSGQTAQAAQTIEGDPTIDSGADDYDNEDEWPYRRLQQEAKNRDMDAGGKRDELVARLRGGGSGEGGGAEQPRHLQGMDTTDADPPEPVQSAEVNPTDVENGGIRKTSRGTDHAGILQGLSDERRQQQLAAVKERSDRDEE